jgi:spore coat polysaccharide biosynthesis protein SpsF (cytidylyltransferase family)
MIGCIVQARLGSSRLPGKVLMDILGKPMLQLMLERISAAKKIDKVIVATTVEESDTLIYEFCKEYGYECYRGSEEDVLDRFYQAAKQSKFDLVLRVTADCPLIDPEIIDLVVDKYHENPLGYVSNIQPRSFPDGLDIELLTFKELERAWKTHNDKFTREHVTSYILKDKVKVGSVINKIDLKELRWTVDYPEDFKFVKKIFEELYYKKKIFNMDDIINLLKKNPQINDINGKFKGGEDKMKIALD